MSKPLSDYTNRCGGCSHFSFFVKDGEVVRRGICDCASRDYFNHNNRHGLIYRARHTNIRSASHKCCRKYEDNNE